MAKTKAELIEEAKKLGVEVDEKSKVAEIKALVEKAVSDASSEEKPVTEPQNGSDDEPQVAKAGKRSAKAIKEAEEQQAKEERKAAGEEAREAQEETGEARTPSHRAPRQGLSQERRTAGERQTLYARTGRGAG